MMKWDKRFWVLHISRWFWLQFNWTDNGWNVGIDYDSNGYTRAIQFTFIKPSIAFGYNNKSIRESK